MTTSRLKPPLAQLAALAAFSLLFAPALSAQNSGRGFFKVQAGTMLGTVDRNLSAGGGFGVRLTDYLDLFAEAGTMQNVMTTDLQSELDAVSNLASLEFGVPVRIDSTIPVEYGLLGARITVPLKSVVTPFFELGLGGARFTYDMQAFLDGVDITPIIREEAGILTDAHLILSASAGAHLAATKHFGFDFALRHIRYTNYTPSLSSNQFHAGIVYRF